METFKQHIEIRNDIEAYVDSLIHNDYKLDNKMKNIVSEYDYIVQTPGVLEKLIEKVFLLLDVELTFSKKGVVYQRYDATFKLNDKLGIVEIKVPSTELLDTPRNILDSIAVSSSRGSIPVDSIIPIVVCWTYPNKRSDFWNVTKDIDNILNIKIQTYSILSLLCMVWLKQKLVFDNNDFFLHRDKPSLDNLIKDLAHFNINENDFGGFFKPLK